MWFAYCVYTRYCMRGCMDTDRLTGLVIFYRQALPNLVVMGLRDMAGGGSLT
jgi:hypothetical protein